MKQTILSLALVGAGLSAAAQSATLPVMGVNDITATAGSTVTVEMLMTNVDEFNDFQADFTFPTKDFVVTKDSYGAYNIATTSRTPKHTCAGDYRPGSDTIFRVVAYSMDLITIKAGEGAILTLEVQVPDTPGVYTYSMGTIEFSRVEGDASTAYHPEGATGTITVTEPEAVRYGSNQLYVKDLTISQGEDATIRIGYNSETEVYEYSADITLPTGVEMTSLTFTDVVDIENYTNTSSFADGVIHIEGAAGRKGPQAVAGDQVIATAVIKTSSLAAGTYAIKVGSQYLSNDDDDYSPADYEAVLTVEGATQQDPCATPEIELDESGNLVITCSTAGAEIHTSIVAQDHGDRTVESGKAIELTGMYDVTAYATADGYEPSDKATAILAWVKPDPNTGIDAIDLGADRNVVLRVSGEYLEILGTVNAEKISLYDVGGFLLWEGNAAGNLFMVPYTLTRGTVYIVQVGASTFKFTC